MTNSNQNETKTTKESESDRDDAQRTSKDSTTDVTDTSDSAKADDKFPRTKTGSARISTKLGKYLVKLKHVAMPNDKHNDQAKETSKGGQEKSGQAQRKGTEGMGKKTKGNKKEGSQNCNEKMVTTKTKKLREPSRKDLAQNTQKRGIEKTNLTKTGTNTVKRTKNSSVTFAPTVSTTRPTRDQTRGRDVSRRAAPAGKIRHVVQDSETSDTDSSGRLDLKLVGRPVGGGDVTNFLTSLLNLKNYKTFKT